MSKYIPDKPQSKIVKDIENIKLCIAFIGIALILIGFEIILNFLTD